MLKVKNMKKIIKLSVMLAFVLAIVSCTDELIKSDYDYVPDPANAPQSVASGSVSDESAVSAVVTGTVEADEELLDWGVVYYSAGAPDNFLVKSAKDTTNNYSFTLSLNGLVPGTDYRFKAFALNKDGISYGDEKSFQTKPAKALPFSIAATDPIATWNAIDFTYIDADGDGNGWEINEGTGLVSYSWYNEALTPENYIIMPPIQMGSTAATINLDIVAADAGYFEEKYKVVISTAPILNPDDARAAETLFEEVLPTADPYTRTIAIPESFNNKVVWIGISHYDCTDMYALIISSVTIE